MLNLTPPAAHVEVTRAALAAGKHVYTEKPLATGAVAAAELAAEAERRGLLLGCAPDIFLGGAYQAARALIDEGAIGEPVAVSAAMLVGGADTWHPSPEHVTGSVVCPEIGMAVRNHVLQKEGPPRERQSKQHCH